MNQILQAQALSKVYPAGQEGPQHILKQVDLTVTRGEFLSVMGPSGSGKSTLLYNISGMDRPTAGSVLLDGQDIAQMPEEALAKLRLERMGFVFQQHNLLKNLGLLDNIVLSAYQLKRSNREEINHRARELMALTGVAGLEDRDITQASGGQLQRVAICRALINNPDILFGDEPTGALNSGATAEVMDILTKVNMDGTTVVLVTHDARVAAYSGRVLFMADGKITAEKQLGKRQGGSHELARRERELSEWLRDQGF